MNNQLRIDSLSVENYRCFKKMDTPVLLQPDLTVLVSRNGKGKTALLDAIKIVFGTFTSSFPITSRANLQSSDAHITASQNQYFLDAVYPVSIKATGMINNQKKEWFRSLYKADGYTTTKDAKAISSFGEMLYTKIKKDDLNVSLPLIAFYGADRLWTNWKDTNTGDISPLAQSRFAGYDNALSSRSTYKQVKNWLLEALKMEDSKLASTTQTGQFVHSQLQAIEKAIQCVFETEGLGQIHYNSFYKDEITVTNNHKSSNENFLSNNATTALPVSYLSDGVRALFSMVADIAYRCAKLNPHLGDRACEETCGIVLIDEVDIFLHPSWQQHILPDLKKAFPNIQLIVTTNSPQVISSVPKECVRIIDEGEIIPFDSQTQGVESQDILAQIFGTDPAPPRDPYVRMLNQFAELIAHADFIDWNQLYKKLSEHFGEQYAPLQRIETHRKFMTKKREGKNA